MANDVQNAVTTALEGAISYAYDHVAVNKDQVLKAAQRYHADFDDWDKYQRKAGLKLMDEIADSQITSAKVTVSGLGAAAGFGGFLTIVPDTIQFMTLTLRMVTGIAAAYGFDPHPDYLKGKVKVLVLQAYLNANLGQAPSKGIEALTLSATTRLFRNAVTRSDLLMKIILAIAKIMGLRVTRQGLLKSIPIVSSGANAGFNWYYARQIANSSKAEFRQFREELRQGKYKGDPDFEGLGAG
jgi:hypothetical protein